MHFTDSTIPSAPYIYIYDTVSYQVPQLALNLWSVWPSLLWAEITGMWHHTQLWKYFDLHLDPYISSIPFSPGLALLRMSFSAASSLSLGLKFIFDAFYPSLSSRITSFSWFGVLYHHGYSFTQLYSQCNYLSVDEWMTAASMKKRKRNVISVLGLVQWRGWSLESKQIKLVKGHSYLCIHHPKAEHGAHQEALWFHSAAVFWLCWILVVACSGVGRQGGEMKNAK